jgi:putative FmdB family regulatory protein
MPMFEYECRQCSSRFESLVFGDKRPSCPSCGGDELVKLLSTFGVGRSGQERAQTRPSCGSGCADFGRPGTCPLN